jgi:uncharacterized membrane protein
MIKLNGSISIRQPVTRVFKFISSHENDSKWQNGTLQTVEVCNDAGLPKGYFRSIGHFLGRRVLRTFQITENTPNQKHSIKSLSDPLQVETSYSFEIEKGYTKVNILTQIQDGIFFETGNSLLGKKMKGQLHADLESLKNILETERTTPVKDAF